MKVVVVEQFGGVDQLQVRELPTPEPGPGQVRVRLTSIGLNHAELMARRGEYRLVSGDPPFTPGLEGGGIIDAIGPDIDPDRLGQRIILSPDATRRGAGLGGSYRSHFIVPADKAMPAPDAIPDDQLGAIWMPYLTAWGCLVWQQQLGPGQIIALTAASSSVALAAAQIARHRGATTIGLTRSAQKAKAIQQLDTAAYDHLLTTHEPDGKMKPWHRDLRQLLDDRGVDVFFDPIAAGEYLQSEIYSLAPHGCIWVYGLLGKPGTVDVTPLIRKHAAIRGWSLTELIEAGEAVWQPGCQHIFEGFAQGIYRQHLGGSFKLDDVQHAHHVMERGEHLGKLVLIP
ncbi:MAG TPA: zinc-binding dehydrogenase [Phycisphaeraceae bacterium]